MKVPLNLVVLKQFKPGKLLTLFFLVFFSLFAFLGTWQLNRANEKTQLAIQVNKSAQQFTEELPVEPYVSFRIAGRFLPEPVFYMDNRTVDGQAGYEVWAFFETEEGTWLVSAGWLAGQESRSHLPAPHLSLQFMALEIIVRPNSENPLYGVEANQRVPESSAAWLVQSLNEGWLKTTWPNKALLGLAQMKDPQLYGVGPSVWQPSVMTVEKHQGYALQWFGMSMALLGMFLYAGFAKKEQNNK
jgi:surfeit locus 1 family protein